MRFSAVLIGSRIYREYTARLFLDGVSLFLDGIGLFLGYIRNIRVDYVWLLASRFQQKPRLKAVTIGSCIYRAQPIRLFLDEMRVYF